MTSTLEVFLLLAIKVAKAKAWSLSLNICTWSPLAPNKAIIFVWLGSEVKAKFNLSKTNNQNPLSLEQGQNMWVKSALSVLQQSHVSSTLGYSLNNLVLM